MSETQYWYTQWLVLVASLSCAAFFGWAMLFRGVPLEEARYRLLGLGIGVAAIIVIVLSIWAWSVARGAFRKLQVRLNRPDSDDVTL